MKGYYFTLISLLLILFRFKLILHLSIKPMNRLRPLQPLMIIPNRSSFGHNPSFLIRTGVRHQRAFLLDQILALNQTQQTTSIISLTSDRRDLPLGPHMR